MTATNLPNPPSVVEGPRQKFLIFEAPNDANLHLYMKEFAKYGAKTVVRACDATYSDAKLEAAGIKVVELSFPDGTSPPDAVVNEWLRLLATLDAAAGDEKPTVGVHCVAGLGRAPVLVAIAMIEGGVEPLIAIKEIRAKRPGALNMPQLKYLQKYKPRGKKCVIQ